MQIVDQDFLEREGERRVVRHAPIPAYRGIIEDRNGEPLAVSTPVSTVWANPKTMMKHDQPWGPLAKSLGMKEGKLRDLITRNQNKQFMYLYRHMNPSKAKKVFALKAPGVHEMTEHRRYYPASEVAAHVVGFTDIDEKGKEGIELAYNDVLTGHAGKKRIIKDLHNRTVKDVGLIANAEPGENVTLSIDLRAQYLAYRELLSAVKEFKADAGSAVALDIKTGEVLAMVNQASYNPNHRSSRDVPSFRNRALTDAFEPGSTVKPFTVAAALESGKWKSNSKVNTAPGYLRVGRKNISDMRNYGVIDVGTIITKSSNVGVSKLALSLEPEMLSSFFRRVGLGQATGVGFPGESIGSLPARQRWRPIEIATLSYGYGVSTTTMQLAQGLCDSGFWWYQAAGVLVKSRRAGGRRARHG